MSLIAACGWTMARTIVLCLLAWPVISGIERWLRSGPDLRRPAIVCVMLAPFLFPELLVGYTYRNVALRSPLGAEWLCSALVLFRMVPAGVVTLLSSPSSLISPDAIHCRWIVLRANQGSFVEWQRLAACYWHGPVRRALPALSLMALVAFQEFELAALLQTASWTDWFIAAQRIGLDRNQMSMRMVWPFLLQLPLLAGALSCLKSQTGLQAEQNVVIPSVRSSATAAASLLYLAIALLCGCLIPLGTIAWNLPGGLTLLFSQTSSWMGLVREIAIASSISVFVGIAAWLIANRLAISGSRSRTAKVFRQLALSLGLMGSLLLSLAVVEVFQQSWLCSLYDTPLPWVLTLIVWLLPRAVLLQTWLAAARHSEGVYLAELLQFNRAPHHQEPGSTNDAESTRAAACRVHNSRSDRLLFRLRDQPRLMSIGLLCYWAYLDLSSAYLLSPTGMSSGLVRLYNFMHFGRSAALSAESVVFFGVPLLAIAILILLLRWLKGR